MAATDQPKFLPAVAPATNSVKWSPHAVQPYKTRKSQREWDHHKDTIIREYASDTRKRGVSRVAHVAKYMSTHHKFNAEEYDFAYRIKKWRKQQSSLDEVKDNVMKMGNGRPRYPQSSEGSSVCVMSAGTRLGRSIDRPPDEKTALPIMILDAELGENTSDGTDGRTNLDGAEDRGSRKRALSSPLSRSLTIPPKRLDCADKHDSHDLMHDTWPAHGPTWNHCHIESVDDEEFVSIENTIAASEIPAVTCPEASGLSTQPNHFCDAQIPNELIPINWEQDQTSDSMHFGHLLDINALDTCIMRTADEFGQQWFERLSSGRICPLGAVGHEDVKPSDLEVIPWCDMVEIRRAAEVYAACCMPRLAYLLHDLTWKRLQASETCDWGFIANMRCKQLAYLSRTATSPEETASLCQRLEHCLGTRSLPTLTPRQLCALRICLARVTLQRTDNNCESAHLDEALAELQVIENGNNLDEDDTDIFVDGQLAYLTKLKLLNFQRSSHTRESGPTRSSMPPPDRAPEGESHIMHVLFKFYEWCRKKLTRCKSGTWDRFSPFARGLSHHTAITSATIRYMNTLHLFTFLWSHEDLYDFSRLVDGHDVRDQTPRTIEYAETIKRQLGISLADVVWTISSILIDRSSLAKHSLLRSAFKAELLAVCGELDVLPESQVAQNIHRRLMEHSCDDFDVETEPEHVVAVRMVSWLTLGMSSLPMLQGYLDESAEALSACGSEYSDPWMRTMASSLSSSGMLSMRSASNRAQNAQTFLANCQASPHIEQHAFVKRHVNCSDSFTATTIEKLLEPEDLKLWWPFQEPNDVGHEVSSSSASKPRSQCPNPADRDENKPEGGNDAHQNERESRKDLEKPGRTRDTSCKEPIAESSRLPDQRGGQLKSDNISHPGDLQQSITHSNEPARGKSSADDEACTARIGNLARDDNGVSRPSSAAVGYGACKTLTPDSCDVVMTTDNNEQPIIGGAVQECYPQWAKKSPNSGDIDLVTKEQDDNPKALVPCETQECDSFDKEKAGSREQAADGLRGNCSKWLKDAEADEEDQPMDGELRW